MAYESGAPACKQGLVFPESPIYDFVKEYALNDLIRIWVQKVRMKRVPPLEAAISLQGAKKASMHPPGQLPTYLDLLPMDSMLVLVCVLG